MGYDFFMRNARLASRCPPETRPSCRRALSPWARTLRAPALLSAEAPARRTPRGLPRGALTPGVRTLSIFSFHPPRDSEPDVGPRLFSVVSKREPQLGHASVQIARSADDVELAGRRSDRIG